MDNTIDWSNAAIGFLIGYAIIGPLVFFIICPFIKQIIINRLFKRR